MRLQKDSVGIHQACLKGKTVSLNPQASLSVVVEMLVNQANFIPLVSEYK